MASRTGTGTGLAGLGRPICAPAPCLSPAARRPAMNLRPAMVAAAVLAAFYASLALCRWGAEGNRDLAALGRAIQRGEELASHIEPGRRRDEAKRALAAEVVAGRMTLRKAAGHFRRLDEADPGYPPGIPRPPGDEVFFCGRVLDVVWEILAQEERFAEV